MLLTDLMPGDKVRFKKEYLNDSRCWVEKYKTMADKVVIIKEIIDNRIDIVIRFCRVENYICDYCVGKGRKLEDIMEIIELSEDN